MPEGDSIIAVLLIHLFGRVFKSYGENKVMKATNLSKLKTYLVSGGVIGAMCVYSAPAYAQIDEVLVTARKVEENLQDVPVSVTAFTGDFFEDAGLVEFADISQLTPNFDVRENNTRGSLFANLTIRGQTTNVAEINSDQAVGIVINGAPVTRGTNLFSNLFDVEQIEVLKGPQGTLFGKNTTGGTVIVTTTTPKLNEFSGYAEVDIGNFDRNDYEVVTNIGAENWAVRLGAAHTNRDGFGEGIGADGELTGRDFADDNEEFYKASLLVEPNDQLSVRINADYHEVDEQSSIHRVLRSVSTPTGFDIAVTTPGDDIFLAADNRLADDPTTTAEEFNLNGTIEYDFGWAELTSVTSFRDQESFTIATYANPVVAIQIGQDSDIFAQELRLSGQALDDKLTWQGGVFYSEEEGEDFNLVLSLDLTAAQNESFSLFGQGSYAVTDRLNLTGGIRWTDEDRAVQDITPGRTFDTEAGELQANEVSFDEISWLASLDYKITDDVLGYVSASKGFRSGFIDQNDVTNILEPEIVYNYEVGIKSDFLDNRVRFNASAYYSDYNNIQIDSFAIEEFEGEDGATEVGAPETIVLNAAEATIWGFEAELQLQPTDELFFAASAGYTNGDFDEFISDGLNVLVEDDPDTPDIDEEVVEVVDLDRSDEPIGGPEWQFNILGRYETNITPNVKAGVQLNYSWIDEQILADDALAAILDPGQDRVESIGLVNGQIDFDVDESWNVAFYGKNIFDNEHFSTGFALATAGGLAQRIVGAPRTYGVRVRKSF